MLTRVAETGNRTKKQGTSDECNDLEIANEYKQTPDEEERNCRFQRRQLIIGALVTTIIVAICAGAAILGIMYWDTRPCQQGKYTLHLV